MKRMVLGIVGPIASGKGYAIDKLVKLGFKKLSLSEEIKGEFKKRNSNKPPGRKELQDLGDEMRLQFGSNFWAKKAAEKIGTNGNFVIDSIRNPEEVKFLKESLGMFLVGINCSQKSSLERTIKRARKIDPTSDIKELKKLIKRDAGINQPKNGQQVKSCISLADVAINNNETLSEFEEKLKKLFIKMGIENKS